VDAVDREILEVLRGDARVSYRSLGSAVGLSSNAAADRVRKLVSTGVIRGFVTVLDESAASGPRLDLLVDARIRPDSDAEAFEAALTRLPAVVEAVHVTGAWDYALRVRVPDATHVDELIRTLKRDAGVEQTQTRLVLRTILGRSPGGRRR
jgi:Lrp/AsnC family leucine-responsive transcriptional regulator